ncbi:Slp family lipoprotein [Solemya velesiana gill symbiont]|nr:Slp family lipoprotein [Solemya velesiana gill symbiont]
MAVLLVGCATHEGIPDLDSPAPKTVALAPERFIGQEVVWGGVVLVGENREQSTVFEILAYPLDWQGGPDVTEPSIGRFQAVGQGYMETGDFPSGRALTLLGTVKEVRVGQVGAADYHFPIVEIKKLWLWSPPGVIRPPRTRVGISVGFRL